MKVIMMYSKRLANLSESQSITDAKTKSEIQAIIEKQDINSQNIITIISTSEKHEKKMLDDLDKSVADCLNKYEESIANLGNHKFARNI